MNVIAYRRVSTDEQGASGLGLEGQREVLESVAAARGLAISEWFEDVQSARDLNRPGFQAMSKRLAAGDTLIVSALDRLSRNIGDFSDLLRSYKKHNITLIAGGTLVDVHTADGRLQAKLLMVIAEHEPEKIGERTSAALQAKKERLGGTLPGTRPAVPRSLRTRLARMREQGMTFRAIAARLEAEKVPTAQGGVWRPGTVKHILVESKTC